MIRFAPEQARSTGTTGECSSGVGGWCRITGVKPVPQDCSSEGSPVLTLHGADYEE
jgi:hypothetical protein